MVDCRGCSASSDAVEVFDGTMRVSFVLLRRHPRATEVVGSSDLQVEWLGGYWKLPPATAVKPDELHGPALTLDDLRTSSVSSFASGQKHTADLMQTQLQEVCTALTPALPAIFRDSSVKASRLQQDFQETEPLLCAFVVARVAAAMRGTRLRLSDELLDRASGLLQSSAIGVPKNAVSSYIHRTRAANRTTEPNWVGAREAAQRAIEDLPTNPNAYYVLGVERQVAGAYQEAVEYMLYALALDPDHKQPYVVLSGCQLRLGNFSEAAAVCRACLSRFPTSVAVQLNLGQALYQMCWLRKQHGPQDSVEIAEMCEAGAIAFEFGKELMPESLTETHLAMLQFLRSTPEARRGKPRCRLCVCEGIAGWRP